MEEGGLALLVPGQGDLGARRLRYAAGGRRLFGPEDVALAEGLAEMAQVAAEGRAAYLDGALAERARIGRDVHDNLGARILTALHAEGPARKDAALQGALADLRGIIEEGFGARLDLGALLADLRAESADRLEARGLALDWRDRAGQGAIEGRAAGALRAVLREALSNALKHAGARGVRVELGREGGALTLEVADDGRGFDLGAAPAGHGLRNLAAQAEAAGGRAAVASAPGGTRVTARLPLAAPAQALRAAE